jgi:hypothetical protein
MLGNLLHMIETDPAPAARSVPVEPLLVFVHIPKTAGTTLGAILRHHYGAQFRRINTSGAHDAERLRDRVDTALEQPEVRVVQGHITFGFRDRFPAGSRFATILREPVECTLSHYSFLVQRTGKWRHDWLQPPSPALTLADCLGERSYIPDNLQTRMLCGGVSIHDPLPANALELAKRHLRERFAYVGTSERFDEFLALLNLELGWPTVAYDRARVTPGRRHRDDLSAEDLQLIQNSNALDAELHAYADELLSEALARAGPELEVELEVLGSALDRWNDSCSGDEATPRAVRWWSLPVQARVELALKDAELARANAEIRDLRKDLMHCRARIRTLKRAGETRSAIARARAYLARLGRRIG